MRIVSPNSKVATQHLDLSHGSVTCHLNMQLLSSSFSSSYLHQSQCSLESPAELSECDAVQCGPNYTTSLRTPLGRLSSRAAVGTDF